MRTTCQAFLESLKEELEQLTTPNYNPALQAEAAIKLINSVISKVNEFFGMYEFSKLEEEIHFFKIIKPQFLSLLFYYNCVYKLESSRPENDKKEIKQYLRDHRVILKCFADENREFLKYYKSGNTCFDQIYFVRGDHDIKQCINNIYFIVDNRLCTNHCYLTAQIIANKRFGEYLESSLLKLKYEINPFPVNNVENADTLKLNWTGSHIAFVELVYALHEDKAINEGDLTITQLMTLMGLMLNIKPGHFSGCYHEMKLRTSPAKYMYYIAEKLLKRMARDKD